MDGDKGENINKTKIIETTRSGKAGRESFSTSAIQRQTFSSPSPGSGSLDVLTDISGKVLIRILGVCLLDTSGSISGEGKAVRNEIRGKLSVYRSGDLKRWGEGCLTEENTPTWEDIAMLMVGKRCKCFYCHLPYIVRYKNVHDPLQWSVDRIDNSKPHIKENIVISCLRCNLRRRQREHREFYDCRNLVIEKEGGTGIGD
jgi:hypothetical protein